MLTLTVKLNKDEGNRSSSKNISYSSLILGEPTETEVKTVFVAVINKANTYRTPVGKALSYTCHNEI